RRDTVHRRADDDEVRGGGGLGQAGDGVDERAAQGVVEGGAAGVDADDARGGAAAARGQRDGAAQKSDADDRQGFDALKGGSWSPLTSVLPASGGTAPPSPR